MLSNGLPSPWSILELMYVPHFPNRLFKLLNCPPLDGLCACSFILSLPLQAILKYGSYMEALDATEHGISDTASEVWWQF